MNIEHLMRLQAVLDELLAQGLPRLDAQMLLLHVMDQSPHDRAMLARSPDFLLNPKQQQRLAILVERSLAGEPTAYLIGEQEFFGLNFFVTPDVLIPRPETELLVQWALEVMRKPMQTFPTWALGPQLLDLGSGSGAVGLAFAHHCPSAQVTLVDISTAALAVAKRNAAQLTARGGAGAGVHFLHSHWFRAVPLGLRFDVIVSNPPYIAQGDPHLTDLRFEPQTALTSGSDGLAATREIVQDASPFLLPGAWLLLEHGYDQAAAVRALLTHAGFEQVCTRKDLSGIERCTGGRKSDQNGVFDNKTTQ